MNTQIHETPTRTNLNPEISLRQLVNQLIKAVHPLTGRYDSLVLNEIPRELTVTADANMLAYVLGSLINCAVTSTGHECVHVEAVMADDRTIIHVRDAGMYYYHTISHQYRQVQYMAEKLGGCISIQNNNEYGTNVTFSLSNHSLAA